MSTALRIALIGGGVMGRQHAEYLRQEPQASLAAVADPYNAALGTEYGVPCFSDYRHMLETVKPDAVIIANPNDQHVGTALACLDAGIPALLEKPVAVSVAEARSLTDAVSRSRVPILVGHHRRHNPIIQQARSILQSGELGRLLLVTAMWQFQKPDDYFDVAWRRAPGAGVLLINLIHDLDLLRHLCGEVVQVQAMTSNLARGFAVEDSAAILLRFESGAMATLTGSDAAATPWAWDQNSGETHHFAQQPEQPCYLFSGTAGSLAVPQLDVWGYGQDKGWKAPLLHRRVPAPQESTMQRQLRHFIQMARGETAPLVTVEDAARTLAVVEAVKLAAEKGCAVRPEPV